METTVHQGDLYVQHREAGQHTLAHHAAEALLNRRPEFTRYVTAGDLGLEGKAAVGLARLQDVVDLRELTGTTGLLLVGVAVFNTLGDGLAVGHLRLAHFNLDTVGTLEDVDLDIQVQLAHTLDDGLAGLFVGLDPEGRVFLDHLVDRQTHLLGTALVLRLDRDGDNRVREDHRLERRRFVLVCQGVTGLGVLQADEGNDVARLAAVQFDTLVGVHLNDTADTLGLAGVGIEQGIALFHGTGIDAGEGQGAKTVVHDLECQGTYRTARINNGLFTGLVTFQVNLRLRRHFGRARQVVDNGVQYQLDALVLERGTAVGREEIQCDGALANATLEILYRRLLALQVGFHQVVVLLDRSLDHLLAPLVGLVDHVGRDVGNFVVFRLTGVVPDIGFHVHQVDHTNKVVLGTDRQHHHQRVGRQHVLYLVHHAVEVCAQAVQLVDEDDTRNLGLVGVAPVGLGLRLNTTGTAEYPDAAVEHLQ